MSAADLFRARADLVDMARPSVAYCHRLSLEWPEIAAHAGGVFMAPIVVDGPWFNFDPGGVEAAVVEARAADDLTVVDLVAWVPSKPERWFRAVGGAPALGIASAANPATYACGQPLQLYRSPEDWVVARCCGGVLLDLDAGVDWLVSVPLARTIAVRDDEHARQIDGARRRLGLPRHQRLVVAAPDMRGVAA